jgi:glucuronosyltransferase
MRLRLKISLIIVFITTSLIFLNGGVSCDQIKENAKNTEISDSKIIKNILVIVFPGGRSHNFVMKDLFDYSLSNMNENETYNYHILVHNWDKDVWPSNGLYTIYSYGDLHLYDVIFNEALDLVRKDPIFGYSKFNKAMVHIYEQFLESKILDELRKTKYDMLITDIPNFISTFLKKELNIEHSIFVCPPSLPNLFYNQFELNPSYLPAIGSSSSELMTFKDRFLNSLFIFGTKVSFKLFMGEQADTFKRYGYDLKTNDVFIYDSLILIQYPMGLFFNTAFPPNIIRLNAVTPKIGNPITQENEPELDAFLNKYKKNIYFSQGTIVKIVDFEVVIGVFEYFKKFDYGFILSFKKSMVSEEILAKFPDNVLLIGWVKQNDLLADPRINGFITHGGTNSVSESVFHFKPMVVLGVTLDQINTAATVRKRNVGVVYHTFADITTNNLIKGVEEILKPEKENIYLQNCKTVGNIIRGNKDPRKEYLYWLQYTFKYGYKHLLIPAYTQYYFFELYNYDVLLVWLLIFYFIYVMIKKLFVFLFCSCKAPSNKRKIKDE